MNRQQFNDWLVANDACSEAVEWCDQHPDLSPHELIAICPVGGWILCLYAKSGYAPEVLAPVAYRAATRAIGYAADILDRAGVQHDLHGVVITDTESARAAARAAAEVSEVSEAAAWTAAWTAALAADAAARAAEWADEAAWAALAAEAAGAAGATKAEHKLCADDCRELLPVWEALE